MQVNVDVANKFYVDCRELLDRYELFINGPHRQSRRLKAYIDLRVAYECALKCAIALNNRTKFSRKCLINLLVNHNHCIDKLEESVECGGAAEKFGFERWGEILEKLPVRLRYSIDAYEFTKHHESLYYETIGSDLWMNSFRSYIDRTSMALGSDLSKCGEVICGSDISLDELLSEMTDTRKISRQPLKK